MKLITHRLAKILLGVLLSGTAFSEVLPFLHPLFTSNMVLQRDTQAPVWGWTTAGTQVTVTINGQTTTATADSTGRWQANVGPFAAGGPYTLSVTGGSSPITLTNVMMGDVFLCSGQSNMAWTVSGCYNASAEVADSVNYPNIRCVTVGDQPSLTENKTLASPVSWQVSSVGKTNAFTATGYFTARELSKQLPGVPIGILSSAWGGTPVESWIDQTTVSSIVDFKKPLFDNTLLAPYPTGVSQLYNSRIAPLAPFKVKGVVWYQGEANAGRGEQYERLLPMMKTKWRSIFGQANLPFIIIQISTDTATAATDLVENNGWAEVRDAQTKTVVADPYSAIVTTLDIGEGSLHPLDKQDVGKRAAKAALKLIYGQNIVHQGPIFTSSTVSGNTIVCNFSNVGGGLMVGSANPQVPLTPVQEVVGGSLEGFSVAGSDKVFKTATATISGNTVVVSSSQVTSPLYVRYAWAKYPKCNLYAKILSGTTVVDGLAAGSFRNDPTYRLNVNSGTGSAYGAYNATLPITASTLPGQTFAGWVGDTSFVADTTAQSTTATLGQNYVSVKAAYNVTSLPTGLAAIPKLGGIQLIWNSMDQVHYKVWRSLQINGTYTVIKELPESSGYLDTNVVEGTTYYYKITVFNDRSAGVTSGALTAQPGKKQDFRLARNGWTATASTPTGGNPMSALDGDSATRWGTNGSQANGQWFQVDMGSPQWVKQIDLEGAGDFPRGYELQTSLDGVTWTTAATGVGASGVTSIALSTPVKAQYLKINQTGTTTGIWWSIYELNVYGQPAQELNRTGWTYDASVKLNGQLPSNAGDNNMSTRWSTVGAQANGQWFMADMGSPNLISEIILDAGASTSDFPRGYIVHVSNDGTNWGNVIAAGAGSGGVTSILVTPVVARYVRVTQTGSTTGTYWSIYEFKVAGSPMQALSRTGWVATVNPVASPAAYALDGSYTTRWTTGALQTNGQWYQVDLGGIKSFREIMMDAASSANDYPRGYEVYVSQDGTNWGSPLATGAGYTANTTIGLQPQTARYIRVVQTGAAGGNYWSIHELNVYDLPSTTPAAPASLAATSGDGEIALNWPAVSNATTYTVKRATSAAGPYTVVASDVLGSSYVDQTITNGVAYYYVVSAVNNSGESTNSGQASATGGALPSPWVTQDIGTTGGAASYASGTYAIAGSGVDIWGTSDQFRYVYQTGSDDCSVVAKVLSVDNTNVWAKAGVMIRESTAPGAVHAAIFATPGAGVSFQVRSATGGSCIFASIAGTAPKWVKITRVGSVFTGSYSADGVTWTQLGTPQTLTMSSSVTLGLAVTAHDATKMCNATLSDVTVTP